MREEEAGMHYLRPLVKQDLAKLNLDGESRRLALKSLKQSIEQLDDTSMPKFLSQIAESRESGVSRSYAISLYEEVARVHGKLIKPHIPRVMSSIIRALATSGSSPQLKQACAKVAAAMVKYTIDLTMSVEDAEEIIRGVCDPLVEALTGKLQHVAAGAAACINAIVEIENWKYASMETIQEICQHITVALSEKSIHTVSHLQLASTLASRNPKVLSFYGATLLKTAKEILKTTVNSWQHRKVATKLLQAVLMILDKETLEIEIDSIIYALECCRFDKMPHVRVAINEALYVAKMLASNDLSQSYEVMTSPLCKSICKSIEHCKSVWTKVDIGQSHSSWTKEDIEPGKQLWTKEDSLNYPIQKQIVSPNSQESNQLSFSPASTSTTESLHISHTSTLTPCNSSQRSNRSPLYLARSKDFGQSSRCNSPNGTFSPMESLSHECKFTPQKLDAKENVPMKISNVNYRTFASQEVEHVQVQAKENLTILMPLTNACKLLTPSLKLDKFAIDMNVLETKDCNYATRLIDQSIPHIEKEASIGSHSMTPMVSTTLDKLTKKTSNVLHEDNVRLALHNNQTKEDCNMRPNFGNEIFPQLWQGNSKNYNSLFQSAYVVGLNNSNQSPSMHQNENCLDYYDVWNTNGCDEGCKEVETRNLVATNIVEDCALGCEGSVKKSIVGSGALQKASSTKHHYTTLAHLDNNLEKSQLNIGKKDFIPFTSPNSLKSDSKTTIVNKDVALCQDDGASTIINIDVEVSSEACWSMCKDQITRDPLFQGDSSHEESEDKLKLLYEDAQYKNIQSPNHVSAKDIQMLSPVDHTSTLVKVQEARPNQQNAFEPMLPFCTPSNLAQIHNNNECVIKSSTFNFCEYMYTPSEGHPISPIFEESNIGTIGKNGLCCHCMKTSEEFTTMKSLDKKIYKKMSSKCNSQSWWESQGLGHAMLVRLVSKSWKNLCWYGEMIFCGTLSIVLTLPLAMALTKVLNTTPEHLVPT